MKYTFLNTTHSTAASGTSPDLGEEFSVFLKCGKPMAERANYAQQCGSSAY